MAACQLGHSARQLALLVLVHAMTHANACSVAYKGQQTLVSVGKGDGNVKICQKECTADNSELTAEIQNKTTHVMQKLLIFVLTWLAMCVEGLCRLKRCCFPISFVLL